MNREKVIKGVHDARRYLEDREWVDKSVGVHIDLLNDAIALLKEQDRLIHKLQNDKDKLCIEISEWKHKYHDFEHYLSDRAFHSGYLIGYHDACLANVRKDEDDDNY